MRAGRRPTWRRLPPRLRPPPQIGDDEATAAFTAWWHAEGVPAGGRLVYNTGRALDLFESLLQQKGALLAEPDALISAIGTRVYEK